MTIISRIQYVDDHPIDRIDEATLKVFQKAHSGRGCANKPVIVLLNAYCSLTDVSLTKELLSDSTFEKIAKGFIGAILSGDLYGAIPDVCKHYVTHLTRHLSKYIPAFPNDIQACRKYTQILKLCAPVWEAQQNNISTESIKYWSDWGVTTRKNKFFRLKIRPLYRSHGSVFTEQVHTLLSSAALKQAELPQRTYLNYLFIYLSDRVEQYPASTFTDPVAINIFFESFLKHIFIEKHEKKQDIYTAIHMYRLLVLLIENTFIKSGVWAMPFSGSLPKPRNIKKSGSKTNIKKNKNGVEIQEKLLTDIPIKLTDEQAMELLFTKINKDIEYVETWADQQTEALWKRYETKTELAKKGRLITGGMSHKTIEEIGPENICATFLIDGFQPGKIYYRRKFGINNYHKVADLLALPTSASLYAYKILLVIEHPEITDAFLDRFELYNKRGQLSGFIKTDHGYQLVGYKDRRNKFRSEMKINLTHKSIQLVKQAIKITEPLRSYLKNKYDNTWKELFLTCGSGFSSPKSASYTHWQGFNRGRDSWPKHGSSIHSYFEEKTPYKDTELLQFLARITLTSIRASCGVRHYLKTKSAHEMSKYLGHAHYNPNLLSHYLPESILAFLQTRWVRIFQKSIIYEAMKDSKYLLKAISFESIDSLHEFLSNHALKEIPSHLADPENRDLHETDDKHAHLYISVNPEILTTLLSLKQAVDINEGTSINTYAKYWSSFAKHIIREIQQGNDFSLKEVLEEATKNADHRRMEVLISDIA